MSENILIKGHMSMRMKLIIAGLIATTIAVIGSFITGCASLDRPPGTGSRPPEKGSDNGVVDPLPSVDAGVVTVMPDAPGPDAAMVDAGTTDAPGGCQDDCDDRCDEGTHSDCDDRCN